MYGELNRSGAWADTAVLRDFRFRGFSAVPTGGFSLSAIFKFVFIIAPPKKTFQCLVMVTSSSRTIQLDTLSWASPHYRTRLCVSKPILSALSIHSRGYLSVGASSKVLLLACRLTTTPALAARRSSTRHSVPMIWVLMMVAGRQVAPCFR